MPDTKDKAGLAENGGNAKASKGPTTQGNGKQNLPESEVGLVPKGSEKAKTPQLEDRVGWYSRWSFSYLNEIVDKAHTKMLMHGDLHPLGDDDHSSGIQTQFEEQWRNQQTVLITYCMHVNCEIYVYIRIIRIHRLEPCYGNHLMIFVTQLHIPHISHVSHISTSSLHSS